MARGVQYRLVGVVEIAREGDVAGGRGNRKGLR